jgi:hypothetical protein
MRKLLVILALLALSASSNADIRLKPGPQLWVFAAKGDISSVKQLVETNAFDKDVLGRAMYNSLRRTELASSPDNLNILKLFLSYGADANYRALNGQTPLIAAVLAKNVDAVRLLLENGADTSMRDMANKTASDYAGSVAGAEKALGLLNNPPGRKAIERARIEPKILNLDLSMENSSVFMNFDLVAEGPVCVKVVGSLNKGATYDMKFSGATGDVGYNIAPGGGKKIVWNSTLDYPKGFSEVDALIDVVAEKCK